MTVPNVELEVVLSRAACFIKGIDNICIYYLSLKLGLWLQQ